MKLELSNLLFMCDKYLFVFYKNENFGYWEGTYPNHIFAINKYGFVCEDCEIHYFNDYLDDDCKIFISSNNHGNYATLDMMASFEEVDKESLEKLVNDIDNIEESL